MLNNYKLENNGLFNNCIPCERYISDCGQSVDRGPAGRGDDQTGHWWGWRSGSRVSTNSVHWKLPTICSGVTYLFSNTRNTLNVQYWNRWLHILQTRALNIHTLCPGTDLWNGNANAQKVKPVLTVTLSPPSTSVFHVHKKPQCSWHVHIGLHSHLTINIL